MSPDFANPVSALLDMIESELNDGTIASVAVTVCSSTGLPTRSATLLVPRIVTVVLHFLELY